MGEISGSFQATLLRVIRSRNCSASAAARDNRHACRESPQPRPRPPRPTEQAPIAQDFGELIVDVSRLNCSLWTRKWRRHAPTIARRDVSVALAKNPDLRHAFI
ncbi:hypothetical protein QNJ80_34760 [Bradyrhizobium elkanii]|nr:hypothetical protein [Bradyrhizobium elkanii]WLB04931.1 hypothetical protein QNJ80_34760 [Bradyrhizobium elkanii]